MSGYPKRQGLYDPVYEHDACGIGFVVNVDGKQSHKVIDDAITVLENLSHRGATGADPGSGDGAGITIQIPDLFFRRECLNLGFKLPSKGNYGVANLFLHKYEDFRNEQLSYFEEIVQEQGCCLLGYRVVPTNPLIIGENALKTMPYMMQAFIEKNKDTQVGLPFERDLYVIRRKAEKLITPKGYDKGSTFYISSLSSKTLVYKGMLTALQLRNFYLDLTDLDLISSIALVHSRFSTNTFPSWERAHPNRYIIHNGEINTIRGNVNWMKARQRSMHSDLFKDLNDVFPIIDESGSDSSMLDNTIEFFYLTGRSLPHCMMMLIPEPWEQNEILSENKREFYKFNNFLMEPWEGPAAIAYTDGDVVGATLDRNGLRPSRYYLTKDNNVILSSEVGVLDFEADDIIKKGRLQPGKMILVDTLKKKLLFDDEIKEEIARAKPYKKWNQNHLVKLSDFETSKGPRPKASIDLTILQKAFGYTYEEIHKIIKPMALNAKEPIGAMGTDSPLAVLSEKPQLLYNYFKQLFAQVTNPPIDGLREKNVISSTVLLGSVGNLLNPHKESKSSMILEGPILANGKTKTIKEFDNEHFKTLTVSTLFDATLGLKGLKKGLNQLYKDVDKGIKEGYNLFVLSDRGVSKEKAAIPMLLAASGLHHHLIRKEVRTDVGIIVETAEAREVHHFATLFGYGVTAINPYLVFETLKDLTRNDYLGDMEYQTAKKNYIKASVNGMLKVITKMGISTLRSYHGAQIFEAVGIKQEVINRYFTGTPSRIEGIGLDEIANEKLAQHNHAFSPEESDQDLDAGGSYQYRADDEIHYYNPETIYLMQRASRENDYSLYKEFSSKVNNESLYTLRNLLEFHTNPSNSIPIEEVESVEEIVKRFKSGAMSYGSISKEAHETIAIAMNRLGARSNSGEGGEDESRYRTLANGDSLSSKIKQVASGRFGVTSNYLVHANELQIKIAQGAKPGEGGHLPGSKVYPEIAKVRHSTPGVGLISPPPHHDIYSIEDLAQLIHDLKMANTKARINVKLVSEVGVGTVAAGVAKGKADVILVSGYDGGTGASPMTSIKHAGIPWELGLSEVHQTLVLNNLRKNVVLETDGKLLTGRDVVIAALLGAEEFGFATVPLVTMGCIMMRVCNKNTCPVGVATQDKELRKNFTGKPEYIVNFLTFVAQEMREIMAKLGIKTVDELIGRTDKLKQKEIIENEKAKLVDLSKILYSPFAHAESQVRGIVEEDTIEDSIDYQKLLNVCRYALRDRQHVEAKFRIDNTNRVVGTMLGSEITKLYGKDGLDEDTIKLSFIGSAGQSFGAFIPKGLTLLLEGDTNDYLGKGLSGGKIVIKPPLGSTFKAHENIIVGNTAFYGGTSGKAFIAGQAGERFAVRNSGVEAVVEGVGDHGCEYMTGGTVVVLGETGQNFAAGMSGGIAYVRKLNKKRCNLDLIDLLPLSKEDIKKLKQLLTSHIHYTKSELGKEILNDLNNQVQYFTKVIPREFRKMRDYVTSYINQGKTLEEANQLAFQKATSEVR